MLAAKKNLPVLNFILALKIFYVKSSKIAGEMF